MKDPVDYHTYLRDIVLLAENGVLFSDYENGILIADSKEMGRLATIIRIKKALDISRKFNKHQNGKLNGN